MKTVKIKDYMSKTVRTIDSEKSVQATATKMDSYNISCIVVTKDKKPVGIVTEKDFVSKVVKMDLDPKTPIKKIMTNKLISIDINGTDVEASRIMYVNKIKKLPVMSKKKLVGIITQTDMLRIMAERWAL